MRSDNRGGARQGAGRKPGGRGMALVREAGAPTLTDGQDIAALMPVSSQMERDRRKLAVCLAARGKSNKHIAQALGVRDETVSRWRQEDWWQGGFDSELGRMLADVKAAFEPMIPDAMEVFSEALSKKRDTHVAADVFDRVYGKPILSQGANASINVVVNVHCGPATGGASSLDYDSADVVDGEVVESA